MHSIEDNNKHVFSFSLLLTLQKGKSNSTANSTRFQPFVFFLDSLFLIEIAMGEKQNAGARVKHEMKER